MRAFIAAKIGLASFVLFWTLAPAAPVAAIFAGLSFATVGNIWRWRRSETRQIEVAGLLLFVALAAGWAAAPAFVLAHSVALSLFALSLAALVSLVRRKPWTADYSAAVYPQYRGDPMFLRINMAISALWAAIFLMLGLLSWSGGAPFIATVLVISGAFLTVFGPKIFVRAYLARIGRGAAES